MISLVWSIHLALSLATPWSLGQSQPTHCTDLYDMACPRSDAAEESGTFEQPSTYSAVQSEIKKNRDRLLPRLLGQIGRPENSRFRNTAIKALNLDDSMPACKSTAPHDIRACNTKIAEGVLDLAALEMSQYYEPENEVKVDLWNINALTTSQIFKEIKEDLSGSINASLDTDRRETRVSTVLLPKTKQRVVAILNRLNIPQDKKAKMIARVNGIKFGGSDCDGPTTTGAGNLQESLTPQAYLDIGSDKLFVCRALLTSSFDEKTLMFVLAHEVAHSIDPCSLSEKNNHLVIEYPGRNLDDAETAYPIGNLLRCLRHSDSVGAYRSEDVMSLAIRKVFGDSKVFCTVDEIGETVPDWFATEALALYMKDNPSREDSPTGRAYDIAQAAAPLCYVGPHRANGIHPRPIVRINRMLLQQPQLRQIMGCTSYSSDVGYCNGIDPVPTRPRITAPAATRQRTQK